eukprot:m51a1_g11950 hypothetical protein (266) ;mRNA; r:751595-752676
MPMTDHKQIVIDPEQCVRCNQCVRDCSTFALSSGTDGSTPHLSEPQNCLECYHCVSVCPTGALSFKSVDPERVLPVLKKEQRATPEQVAALVRERRSTRRFSKTPLGHDVIMTLLRRVAPAPSGHNVRAVRWMVIETPAVIEDLKRHTIEALRQCATDGQNVLTRDAPHILVAYVTEGGRVEDIDVTVALETAELVASSMGLGTCWNGLLFNPYLTSEPLQAPPEQFYEKLGVPRGSRMQCLVLGTPLVHYHRSVDRGVPPVSFV